MFEDFLKIYEEIFKTLNLPNFLQNLEIIEDNIFEAF